MSDFGPSGSDAPTSADRWRYAWLVLLASLLLAVVLAPFENTLVLVVAVYLLAAAVAGLVVLVRRSRS